jgi:Flp pilus assembly CpaF family ATPase
VRCGLNMLVSGGTQAGKTTLLNCLAAAVPPQEIVVTAEEVFEFKNPGLSRTSRVHTALFWRLWLE